MSWNSSSIRLVAAVLCLVVYVPDTSGDESFVNWEHPQVHPVDLTPNRAKLLVVNTADARLEIFDVSSGRPLAIGSVPVGLDPVTVRARSNTEAWVVNHVSDSVSVVDITAMHVIETIQTGDEPTDVVFAGSPVRAFVCCSQINLVQVFDPTIANTPIASVTIDAEDPRSLAVSPDGRVVYAAVFESGNASMTLPNTGFTGNFQGLNTVNDLDGPHGGLNPPPNDGDHFTPSINPELPLPPKVALIAKKNAESLWMDDNGGDWTDFISGPLADRSSRPVGWDLPDHDVAMIDAQTLGVTYATGLMNLCMALAVNPLTGIVTVVGTDATNEIRFEPVVKGTFIRVNASFFNPAVSGQKRIVDLNPHLTYDTGTIPQTERNKSIGDPRGIVWNGSGTKAFVTGMGSNNVVVIDHVGDRVGIIEVGQGPTGVAIDEGRQRLYVLNRLGASISTIDTKSETELEKVAFFDPTPAVIKVGRPHLYDTHRTSGLGHIACASCHADARTDRLAWDLGNPSGSMKEFNQNCSSVLNPCIDWHPMKGPLLTQTLQDVIGKEPFHWRGDKEGIEQFNGAFASLHGDDTLLTTDQMQEFKDFLATITFPPNPYRNYDNTLPTDLPLSNQFTPGRFGPQGLPLPNGDAARGLRLFRRGGLQLGRHCVTCHTLPTGMGTNYDLDGLLFKPLPQGADGSFHHATRLRPGNVNIKIPQLRNLYDRVGMEATQLTSRAGFGFLHDGQADSIARLLTAPGFSFSNIQQLADVIAFLMAFSGSDIPVGSPLTPRELPGPSSKDTHAAVGIQVTLNQSNRNDSATFSWLVDLMALADTEYVGLIAKGGAHGQQRGYVYEGNGLFQSDRLAEHRNIDDLRLSAGNGTEITFTIVPAGTATRIAIDRDEDGHFDRDEIDACSSTTDATSVPGNIVITGDIDGNGRIDAADTGKFVRCVSGPASSADDRCRCSFDFDLDGSVSLDDFAVMQKSYAPSK